MAERHTIQASVRTILGKETKRLRKAGQLPGVVYGPIVSDPISVTVDMKELDRMYHAYGSNLLVDLSVDGGTYPVYMRTVTMNRLARLPEHVEFYAPNMRIDMTASVPVMLVGEPENTDGLLTQARETVDVRGLPDSLPSSFEVDVSILAEIDQAIYVSDLVVPEGVELLTDGEEMLVKLNAPTLQRDLEAEDAVADEQLEDAALAGGVEVAEGDADTGEPVADEESGA
ncbi:MAG TPA: 50S ribosomal protein L25 [Thermomicrobiales bacterium]|nr:50S ribosomal protein L25 [Thermomicrobiales bacterium]